MRRSATLLLLLFLCGWQLAAQQRPRTARPATTEPGHTDAVIGLAVSRDGKWLASASADKTVKLWNLTTGKAVRTFNGHTDKVWVVSFAPDGKAIASGSEDKSARIWQTATGRSLHVLSGKTEFRAVEFSPDGRWLATMSGWNWTKWDTSTGEKMKESSAPMTETIAVSPDGKWVGVAGAALNPVLWHAETWGMERMVGRSRASGYSTVSVAFSPDARFIAAGRGGGEVGLWKIGPDEMVELFQGPTDQGAVRLAFSPGGIHIAAGFSDQTVQVWKLTSDKPVARFQGVYSLALCFVDEQTLATGMVDGSIVLWDISTGSETRRLR